MKRVVVVTVVVLIIAAAVGLHAVVTAPYQALLDAHTERMEG